MYTQLVSFQFQFSNSIPIVYIFVFQPKSVHTSPNMSIKISKRNYQIQTVIDVNEKDSVNKH